MAIASGRDFAAVVRDEARFRDWYETTLPRIYRYLAARCAGDDALAEELTQQTFVAAIRQRHRFDGRSDVVTWMCAIGRNKLVDHHRRLGRDAQRHERLIADHPRESDGPWRETEARDTVRSAMEQLPADQRIALLFRYLDDLSVRDVASAIGRSEKATESLLARGRESFRRSVGGQTDA